MAGGRIGPPTLRRMDFVHQKEKKKLIQRMLLTRVLKMLKLNRGVCMFSLQIFKGRCAIFDKPPARASSGGFRFKVIKYIGIGLILLSLFIPASSILCFYIFLTGVIMNISKRETQRLGLRFEQTKGKPEKKTEKKSKKVIKK